MVVPPRLEPLKNPSHLPVASLIALALGMLAATVFVLIPTNVLESLVIDSGIASVLSAAEPPLGITARAVLILASGGLVTMFAYVALLLLVGRDGLSGPTVHNDQAPVLRRADAHPDAPPRRPVLANRDLGTPFLEVRAEAAIAPIMAPVIELSVPANLDLPLAAYDPGAIPDVPVDWYPVPSPLAMPAPDPARGRQVFATTERFETFPLTPVDQPAAVRPPLPPRDPSATIHELLDRLERGAARRQPVASPPPRREQSLQDTLAMLRHLAAQASETSPRRSALRG